MSTFLIQVNGKPVEDFSEEYRNKGGEGPRICDDPINNGFYLNTKGTWRQEGWGKKEAWQTVEEGDKVLVYCTGDVEEHSSCLSHILTVEDKIIDRENDFAKLTFETPTEELDPKIPYQRIQNMVDRGELSNNMRYCGMQGFNITKVEDKDLNTIREESESGKNFIQVSRERDLHEFLEENPDIIEHGLSLPSRDDLVPERLKPDLLFKDQNGDYLVVELKAGKAEYHAVGQIGSYIGGLQDKGYEDIRGMLVAKELDEKAKYGAKLLDLEVRTYEMDFKLKEIDL